MIRRILVLTVTAILLSACSDSPSAERPAAPRKVTLMLDWTPNTNHSGIYLAREKGYYAQEGLDIEILQPGEQGALPALGTGSVDFAVTVQESLIPARAQGVPAVSIASILSTNTSSLVSLAGEGITRPRDLQGKVYGGFGGELERELVSRLVSCDGGDPSKVRFVDVGNADYRLGLEKNQYDFAWVFNGWDVIRLRQAGVAVSTIAFADHFDCIPDWYTPLLATTQKHINRDPDLVRKFLEATERGYRDAIDDPAAAANALLAGAPELDATLVRASSDYLAPFYASKGKPWGRQDRSVWVNFEQFLRDAKLVDTTVNVDSSFTNEYLPRA